MPGSDDEPAPIAPERLSQDQKQKRVEQFLGQQRKTFASISETLQEARAARDMVQLNCLNNKVEQVKGLLKISEASSVAMYDAISRGDEEEINAQYTKIALANNRSQALQVEANRCIGINAVFSGNTQIELSIEGDIETVDPTLPTLPPVPVPIPPVASGT